MKNILNWAGIAACSIMIYFNISNFYSSTFHAIMMLIINTNLRLSAQSGRVLYTSLLFELILSFLSALFYYLRPIYSVIFWIYFSPINKFAVEEPVLFTTYGQYSIYLGYSCSTLIFAIYAQHENDILLRYGSLWIFLIMISINFTWIYKFRNQSYDVFKLGIITIICLSSLVSMINNSSVVVIPVILISILLLLYEIFRFLSRLTDTNRSI